MKLEDQVCSLSLAQRLKELGVKQESYFYWGNKGVQHVQPKSGWFAKWPSAFTVAELGEMLPCCARNKDGKFYDLKIFPNHEGWVVLYTRFPAFSDLDLCVTREKTEADARAKMLIYLLEKNLLPKAPYPVEEGDK